SDRARRSGGHGRQHGVHPDAVGRAPELEDGPPRPRADHRDRQRERSPRDLAAVRLYRRRYAGAPRLWPLPRTLSPPARWPLADLLSAPHPPAGRRGVSATRMKAAAGMNALHCRLSPKRASKAGMRLLTRLLAIVASITLAIQPALAQSILRDAETEAFLR